MTRPTARVLALLEILQGGGTHTATDLATRLGVNVRTVRRYADHLADLEIPIESVRGRFGGYRLAPGFRLPPLMLTDDEALAVLLGLATGPQTDAAREATAKIRRVLPKTLAGRLDAVFETTGFTAPPRPAAGSPEAVILLELAEAARDRHPVVIGYTDRAGNRTDRTVHPYGIVAHAGRWYLSGSDESSGEVRTFRLDRITGTRAAAGSFSVPADFDPREAVLAGLARTPWRHEVVIRVRGTETEIRRRLPRSVATLEPDGDRVVVRLRAERLDWLPAVLAGLGLPFVIEKPAELRAAVQAWAAQLSASAGGLAEI